MSEESIINKFKKIYHDIIETALYSHNEAIFKLTNKSSFAMVEIEYPRDRNTFEKLTKNLYITIYEASGYSKRIPHNLDENNIVQKIKDLRNNFEHDQEQGLDSQVRKRYANVAEIYNFLIGKRCPSTDTEWAYAGKSLIEKTAVFLENIKSNLNNPKKEEQQRIPSFFEHDITVFPTEKKKFRLTNASEIISGGDSLLLLPTFNFSSPAEFGNTQSAVYLTSEAQDADFKSFKTFIREIEKLWTAETDNKFAPASKVVPWSITVKGEIAFGSGAENLISALEKRYKETRAAISIILQGIYGPDNNHTFFIIIGSDLRGGRFTYNFIDFYLSSIPIEWDWITSFNKTLDKLSEHNQKASCFTLKQYVFKTWESKEELEFKNEIPAGIGRNGYENREWDDFEALIIKKDDLLADYSQSTDSWKLFYEEIECPITYLEEYTVSIPRISYEKIHNGELIGIRAPTIFLLGFEGKGWTIYAVNIKAWPKLKEVTNEG